MQLIDTYMTMFVAGYNVSQYTTTQAHRQRERIIMSWDYWAHTHDLIREMQEKAADRQSEIDALRAKRAFEEGERQARAKEVAEKERMIRQANELEEARKKQFSLKEQTLANQAKAERDDFLRIIDRQKEDEQKEREME